MGPGLPAWQRRPMGLGLSDLQCRGRHSRFSRTERKGPTMRPTRFSQHVVWGMLFGVFGLVGIARGGEPLWKSQVAVSPDFQTHFLGTPNLIRLDNGELLATYDHFGPATGYNMTSVAKSTDNGESWAHVTDIVGSFWPTLFEHRGSLYLMGQDHSDGNTVIRRSDDNGQTWTTPADSTTGFLLSGRYAGGPTPVAVANGRIFRAVERVGAGGGFGAFRSFVMSAPVDADLLNADNWTASNELPFDPAWLPTATDDPGWLEGNMVVAPSGEMWNILRVNSNPDVDKAAIVRVSPLGTQASFDRIIDMPGGRQKFTIRRDPVTGLYLSFVNNNTDPSNPRQRNVMSLIASDDLIHWEILETLLEDDQGLSWEQSMALTGFQYVDWRFDGDDITYLVRTAYDGVPNFHDSNRITYHVLEDYVSVVPEPSTVALLVGGLFAVGAWWAGRKHLFRKLYGGRPRPHNGRRAKDK